MSISEQLGIPRPPKKPSLCDQQLARFVVSDLEKHPSGFCGRALLTASDGYGSSGAQCRKKGWIYRSGFGVKFKGCPAIYTWFLTDTGKVEARAAVERIAAYKQKSAEWGELFKEARARMIAENAQATLNQAPAFRERDGEK